MGLAPSIPGNAEAAAAAVAVRRRIRPRCWPILVAWGCKEPSLCGVFFGCLRIAFFVRLYSSYILFYLFLKIYVLLVYDGILLTTVLVRAIITRVISRMYPTDPTNTLVVTWSYVLSKSGGGGGGGLVKRREGKSRFLRWPFTCPRVEPIGQSKSNRSPIDGRLACACGLRFVPGPVRQIISLSPSDWGVSSDFVISVALTSSLKICRPS